MNAVYAAGLTAALFGSGCGSPEPPRPPPTRGAPTSASAPAPASSGAKRIAPANVEALTVALKGKGHTVVAETDGAGRVRALEYRAWERSAAFVNAYPEPHVRAFVKAHGDALGYGPLGEGSDDIAMHDELVGGQSMVLVPYPSAEGCPGLAVLFHYSYGFDVAGVVGTPMGWEFLCPTEPRARDRIKEARARATGDVGGVARSREVTAALEREPLVTWLAANGFGRPTMVERTPDSFRVELPNLGRPEARSAMALAREVAERAAALSGLPKLDKVTAQYTAGTRGRPRELSGVELGESTASRGACAAPRVVVSLHVADGPAEVAPPSVKEVQVSCVRSEAAADVPADSARALPRTFATSPEYLVHCYSTSYAWGTSNTGLVVDRRGDVYSYSGGPPTGGATVSALAAQLRHGKAFHGTLPAADVERLVELIPKIAKEKWQSKPRQVFDGPSGACTYLRSGATKDALVKVPIESHDNGHEAFRDGEATRTAEGILGRAHTLKARGR